MEICVSLSAISRYSRNISSWYMLTNVSPRYMLTQPDRFDVALLHLDRPVFYQVFFAPPSLVDVHQVPVHQLYLFVWLHFLDSTVLGGEIRSQLKIRKNYNLHFKTLQDNIIPVCLPPGDISLSGKNIFEAAYFFFSYYSLVRIFSFPDHSFLLFYWSISLTFPLLFYISSSKPRHLFSLRPNWVGSWLGEDWQLLW